MNINLYVNYYDEKNSKRRKEIDICVGHNLNNPLINVVLFESQKRLKFSDYFRFISLYTSDKDVNIIANLDIYFDETIKLCSKMMTANDFYALSRWDVNSKGENARHWNRAESQDAWIFRGKPKSINADFCLGLRGSDNKIAYEAKEAGYCVTNPSSSIKCYHMHSSRIRNYSLRSQHDKVPPPYLTVNPTKLK
jgi:hypothetical protein